MKRRFFYLILSAMLAAKPVFACYSPAQVEAEQGLRIQSELMVIALTCAKAPGGQEMYAKYQSFTRKNAALLNGYEGAMIRYYQTQGQSRPEESLHTLRTSLSNQISQHAISMSTASFCQRFGARIDAALAMDQTKLRRWAQHVWASSPPSAPMCAVIQ